MKPIVGCLTSVGVLSLLLAGPAEGQGKFEYRGFRPSMSLIEFMRAAQRLRVDITCESGRPKLGGLMLCSSQQKGRENDLRVIGAVDTVAGTVSVIHVHEPEEPGLDLYQWYVEAFSRWGFPDTADGRTSVWLQKGQFAQVDTTDGHRRVVLGLLSSAADMRTEKKVTASRFDPTKGPLFLERDLDDPPRLVSCPPPEYPPTAFSAKVEDYVRLEFVVDTAGVAEPGSFEVRSAKWLVFVESAVEAVLRCQYQPGKVAGKPVRALVSQGVSFTFGSGR